MSAVLIAPMFRADYLNIWYTADGPMVSEVNRLVTGGFNSSWNPNLFCGTRSDVVFPPAPRLISAFLAKQFGLLPVRAYHVYLATLWCLGIAGVYALVRAAQGQRVQALLAAALSAIVSPSFLLLPDVRRDAWVGVPQRLGVMLKYGDGPHIAGLGLVCWALAFFWLGVRTGKRAWWAAGAFAGAFAIAHGFASALVLVTFLALLAYAIYIEQGGLRVALMASFALALALAIPSFAMSHRWWRATLSSLPQIVRYGDTWSLWLGLALPSAVVLASDKKRGAPAWLVWCLGGCFLFGAMVLLSYYLGRNVVPGPLQYIPELDLLLILVFCTAVLRLPKLASAVTILVIVGLASPFLMQAWSKPIYPIASFQDWPQERLQRWLSEHAPNSRVWADRRLSLWLGATTSIPQVGAGVNQGIRNAVVAIADWELRHATSAERTRLWLQALGADAAIVQSSSTNFAELAVLQSSGSDRILAVPRRWKSLARVVRQKDVAVVKPLSLDRSDANLRAYVHAVESGPDSPATTEWLAQDLVRVKARLQPGESVIAQITFDPVWRAYENDRPLAVTGDPADFLRIDLPPGEHEFYLVFRSRKEPFAYAALSLSAILLCVIFLWKGGRS
ncbi:MAG TPA: hypothetical protein VE621_19410 [Bryobacteraceae bacterium]|nr:hypothetical protein [Bryobacteraceae bacterium]